MWVLLMFDLPVRTKQERKLAQNFRLSLLDNGFEMAQFSVYLRYCSGRSEVETYISKIKANVPGGGKIDILTFTDKQYENIISFHSGQRKNRVNPSQYVLF
jgi:CRISPR-associated protein Cas2